MKNNPLHLLTKHSWIWLSESNSEKNVVRITGRYLLKPDPITRKRSRRHGWFCSCPAGMRQVVCRHIKDAQNSTKTLMRGVRRSG